MAPSPIHHIGAFARRDIPPYTAIAAYLGERIGKEESARRLKAGNDYIYDLDEASDIDGSGPVNLAKYINHSCAPNCESVRKRGLVEILTTRPVSKGEELTMNYGYDLDRFQEYPCRCGSPRCVGFMVAEEHYDWLRSARMTVAS